MKREKYLRLGLLHLMSPTISLSFQGFHHNYVEGLDLFVAIVILATSGNFINFFSLILAVYWAWIGTERFDIESKPFLLIWAVAIVCVILTILNTFELIGFGFNVLHFI